MLAKLLGMESPLFNSLGLLMLRLGVGMVMLFAHGLGKLNNWSEYAPQFGDPIGVGSEMSLALAIFAEVFCSILLILGAVTRLAAIPLAVTMFVAHFIVHAADPWMKKELSFIYLVAYLVIFLLGPGRFSVDALLLRKK